MPKFAVTPNVSFFLERLNYSDVSADGCLKTISGQKLGFPRYAIRRNMASDFADKQPLVGLAGSGMYAAQD
jgi:hypothetical protein